MQQRNWYRLESCIGLYLEKMSPEKKFNSNTPLTYTRFIGFRNIKLMLLQVFACALRPGQENISFIQKVFLVGFLFLN